MESLKTVDCDEGAKSDDELFTESLSARTAKATQHAHVTFPLLNRGKDSDSISLCDRNLRTLRVHGKQPQQPPASPASGRKIRPRYNNHLLLELPSHNLPRVGIVGSTLSLANRQLPESRQPSASTSVPSEVQPRRKLHQIVQQASLQFGLEFCFSIEGALVIPILLQLGLPEQLYGLAWFLPPIFGFLLTPFLGSGSDRCQSPMGQRRPFILGLGIVVCIGISLLLNSSDLGALISDTNSAKWSIAITMIAVILTEFGMDSSDTPFKAYIIDCLNLEDIRRAFSIRSFLGGIGGGIGFICVGINWESTYLGEALGGQLRVVFLFFIIVFVNSLVLTLTSIKEKPLRRSIAPRRRSNYAPCNNEDGERTRRSGAPRREKGRTIRSFLRFLKSFRICRRTKTKENVEQVAGENLDKSRPRDERDNASSTRKHFIPSKKGKDSSKKAKKSEGLPGSSCIVKVGMNDDAKDLLKRAVKMNGGQCQMPEALPHCDGISSAVNVCNANPSVEVCCSSDEDIGEGDDDDDNKNAREANNLSQSTVEFDCVQCHGSVDLSHCGSINSMVNICEDNPSFEINLENKEEELHSNATNLEDPLNSNVINDGQCDMPKASIYSFSIVDISSENVAIKINQAGEDQIGFTTDDNNSDYEDENTHAAEDFPNGVVKTNGQYQSLKSLPQCGSVDSLVKMSNGRAVVEIDFGREAARGDSGEDADVDDEDDDGEDDQGATIKQLLRSAVYMPRELRYLCFTNFFSWASMIVTLCFYTDFVAQAVYHGDPGAPKDSEEFRLYEEGVQMGSWGLCIYSFGSSLVSLAMPVLQRHLSQKCLYTGCQLIFAAGCAASAMLTNHVYVVLALCVTCGLMLVILNTIPHHILANYHKSEKYKYPEKGLPRGLATDLACLDCQVFLSQIIISAAIGPLIQLTGSHLTIMISASIFAMIAALSAGFLVTYEIKVN